MDKCCEAKEAWVPGSSGPPVSCLRSDACAPVTEDVCRGKLGEAFMDTHLLWNLSVSSKIKKLI